MGKRSAFYDRYHLKNQRFFKVIRPGNFTYFYTLDFLHKPYLLPILRQGQILDVGCGVGALSLYAARLGAKVTGIDISARAIGICNDAKKALGFKNVSFKEAELTAGQATFDLAICSEIIEHVPDDQKFAKLLLTQLKPGGFLYLSTPSLDTVLYRFGFYTKFDSEVGHLRRYTEQSLAKLLEKAGWEIVELRSVEGPLRNILYTTRLGFVIKFIKGPLVPLFHLVDGWSARIFGASDIQVIARKPMKVLK